MPTITFIPENRSVSVDEGTTLLAAARAVGLVVESPCDGIGTCGKCKVRIVEGADGAASVDEGHRLPEDEEEKGFVLACCTIAQGDIVVEVESTADRNKTLKILSEGASFDYELDPSISKSFAEGVTTVFADGKVIGIEQGDTTDQRYGLAIDIGTTTVVCALIDMGTGDELGSLSALNPQSLHAQDVLTRIKFASTQEGLDEMYRSISSEMDRMARELCVQAGVESRFVYEAVYSGNTTMIHLATGVSPASLGKFPYIPLIKGGNHVPAAEHGLFISPFGLIYLPPIITAFVGPDITSGLLAARLNEKEGTTLFIDIGTNGEMMIARDGTLSATSTAAGPAFEGMNITSGMRAGDGAIEYFAIGDDGSLDIRTIGGADPVGICGSGLFDIMGELAHAGVIGKNGRFVSSERGGYPAVLGERLVELNGKPAFKIAEGVHLTQGDIRQVQLAKGAVRAGVEAMMMSVGVSESEVDTVQIAGSFGYHLRAESLVNIALIPEALGDRIEFVGNTSKSGARAFLLNRGCRAEMEGVVPEVEGVELSNQEGFDKLFVKCLSF